MFSVYQMVKRCFLGGVFTLVILIAYFINISLVAFQKSAMITPVGTVPIESFAETVLNPNHQLPDVRLMIESIPYKGDKEARTVYDILPQDRYHKTIQQGDGNCSNLVFGIVYKLMQDGYPYQIVGLLPPDGFLRGIGHTFLSMPYELDGVARVGLVDMLEGGIPQNRGKFLDLTALLQKHLESPSVLPLNNRKDDKSEYYGDFLDRSVIGVTPDAEVGRYYSFLNRVYIPFGPKRLERIIYSGTAMVLGVYPRTYITSADYEYLFAGKSHLPWMAWAVIWIARLVPILLIIRVLLYFLLHRSQLVEEGKAISLLTNR